MPGNTNTPSPLRHILPVFDWGRGYTLHSFRGDAIAGLVVLFITLPQVVAYAYLAGMPAEAGLYAAFMSLIAYSLFGSSRALAVGPTAIVGMMTLQAASRFALPGEVGYTEVVVQLSLVTGLILILLRLVNFGSVISFLSHAVVTGFISGAALLIIANQLPAMLGLPSSPDSSIPGLANWLADGRASTQSLVIGISLAAVLLLLFCSRYLPKLLQRLGLAEATAASLARCAPMYAVLLGVLIVGSLPDEAATRVPVVGEMPTSLPQLQLVLMDFARFQALVPSAFLIAMVIFMESISIGTAIASKSREKVNPNQELVGLGTANLGASLVGGFPVAGSFARSIVNFTSGSVSPLSSLVTACLLLLSLLMFAGLFHDLPKGVLSAIIVVSAWQLLDVSAIRKIFKFNLTDAITFTCTFLTVLSFGVESGVIAGVVISFVLLIRSSSKPHIAVVGRVGASEHFRNIERHEVKTSPRVLAIRVDESFYFVNSRYIEAYILNRIAEASEVEHLLLICTAANFIDTSGLEMLEQLSDNLQEVGVTLHLAEVKGPVMDKLRDTEFCRHMKGQVFFTTDLAMKELGGV